MNRSDVLDLIIEIKKSQEKYNQAHVAYKELNWVREQLELLIGERNHED